jgi:excisionase family DNA binding protein
MNQDNKQIEEILQVQNQILQILSQQQVSHSFINKEAACRFLGYGSSQLSKLLKKGEIEHSKIGRRVFIDKVSLNDFLTKQKCS